MKLEDTLYQAPELNEEKFVRELEKNIAIMKMPFNEYHSLFRDRDWTPEELVKEYELIQYKESKLSKFKRDAVQVLVTASLLNMFKEESDDDNS